jgi:hypothetical protein
MSRVSRLGWALIFAIVVALLVMLIPAVGPVANWVGGLAPLTIVIWAFLELINRPAKATNP